MLPRIKPYKKPIYLDHAATTYLDPRVEKAMRPFWHDCYGNPSSLYKQGRVGANAISESRQAIAKIINCKPAEIIFTAGGTESVNLAIFGAARQYELVNKRKGHLIASSIEHHAVIRSFEALKQEGWDFTLVDVDSDSIINLKNLKKAVRHNTVLISVMYANNEIGTIEPIAEIGKWLKQLNDIRIKSKLPKIVFHTDACQAAGALDLNVQHLNVDLMTINGSKIYGPKQVGLLYIRSGVTLRPLIFGGGQEKNLRSGTENVPGIVGLAEALRLVDKEKVKETSRLTKLRDYFIAQLFNKIPQAKLNGHPKLRLPNNLSVTFPGVEGETLLLYLDSYNIEVSTGSACTSTSEDPSHVIMALGKPVAYAKSTMRFSLGRETKKAELDYVMTVLPDLVKELKGLTNSLI